MNKVISTSSVCELFGGEFELRETGFSTGEYNMQFDINRTMECADGKALPMFRFYGWKPWSVSLGANQKEDDIDIETCNELGFSVVRRPTGGRAVLHADELTYSVVLTLPEGKTVHDIYREIHLILLNGLKNLGCNDLEFIQSQNNLNEFYKQPGKSASCFASSAKYEISWKGRKVIGSAQRLFGKTLLQHGSILLGSGHEMLAKIISNKSEENEKKLKEYILSHSTTFEEICGRKIYYDECLNAILKIINEETAK